MAEILKVTVAWSGFTGSPGYTNFFWKEDVAGASFDAGATAAADAVNVFFGAIKTQFPDRVKWKVQSDVPVIESTTGQITSIASAGARTEISGTGGAGAYSAASGSVVTWRTNGVRNGRRVRGRTFLVPLANLAYDADGTMNGTATGIIGTAATALVNTAGPRKFGVYARPTTKGASDGEWFPVLTASVPDAVAILKSRRD